MGLLDNKKNVELKLTVEQASYVEIAIREYADTLRTLRSDVKRDSNTLYNVSEIDNRVNILTNVRHKMIEVLDAE